MANITFELPDQTIPLLINAFCTYNGTISMFIPAYQAQVINPNWTPTIDDGSGNLIPNPSGQLINNPITPGQYTTNQIIEYGKTVMFKVHEGQVNDATKLAIEEYKTQALLDAQSTIESGIAIINTNVIVTVT